MTTSAAARLAGGAAVALAAGAVVLNVSDGGSANPYWRAQAFNAALYGAVGGYLAGHRPARRFGWLLAAVGVGFGVTAFTSHYAFPVDSAPLHRPLAPALLWAGSWTWAVSLGLLTNGALLLFPDGRLPSRRWWPAAAFSAAATALMVAALASSTWGLGPDDPEPAGGRLAELLPLGSRLLLAGAVVAAASLVVRYARAPQQARGALRAVTASGVAVVVGTVASWASDTLGFAGDVVAPLLVAAVAFAVLRHRLYDLDVVLNRTLVYAGLSAAVAGTYAVTVALLGSAGSDAVPPLVASAAVALAFAPARDRLQRAVDRLLYGDRHDPLAAIERLGRNAAAEVAPGSALDAVVQAVAQALRVPGVALEVPVGERVSAVGDVSGADVDVAPLVYQGELVGRLLVRPRPPASALGRQDRRLLDRLAVHVATIAHGIRLAAELQRSRERLVTAREEERRRVRRNLHDGLGARLSGVVLGLQAARNLVERDPRRVAGLLDELCADTQDAIADVRRLVYELRPPALDELGLVDAIRQHAAALDGSRAGRGGERLTVRVEAPDDLGSLPAAVEVAVYWVAVEAMTNVVRHAGATTCVVRLSGASPVEVEVSDDGRGLPAAWVAGVGVCSMRERVTELGGTLAFEPAGGGRGTRVLARVPVAASVPA